MIIIVFFQEGPSGIFTINSPVAGEVVECNEILKKQPKVEHLHVSGRNRLLNMSHE